MISFFHFYENKAESILRRDKHGDLSYWAELEKLGEDDFTEESMRRELEEARNRLLEELHSRKNDESEEEKEKPVDAEEEGAEAREMNTSTKRSPPRHVR